jgi:Acetokinase family
MGLTPLNGLPGATRSGAVDPSLIFHYTNQAGKMSHAKRAGDELHVTEVSTGDISAVGGANLYCYTIGRRDIEYAIGLESSDGND